MSTIVTWSIESLSCYPVHEGQVNVVCSVAWRADADNGSYSAATFGSVAINYVADEPYTPYDQLTQDQVLGWVKAAYGDQVAVIEASLATNIENQVNPSVVIPSLPWGS